MQPVVVFPLHDPAGAMFSHLERIEPFLLQAFSKAVIGITPETSQKQPDRVKLLRQNRFYHQVPLPEAPVGDQFSMLFQQAASASPPDILLHLCFVDRLAFILQSEFASGFLDDINGLVLANTPLLFTRSKKAWDSHPQNYYEIEQFATQVGSLLFGRALDFAWCHLAIQASLLDWAIPQLKYHDLSLLGEITLLLKDTIHTRAVDWLAWEDPYLLGVDAAVLKARRENSREEVYKRLGYILPTVELMIKTELEPAE